MPGVRVLIYGPDQRFLMSAAAALAQEGFEVSGTTSEKDALARFQSGGWEALLFAAPTAGKGEAPTTLVLVKAGMRTFIGVPLLPQASIFAVENEPDALRRVAGRLKSMGQVPQAGLLTHLTQVVSAASLGKEDTLPSLVNALAKLVEADAWLMAPQEKDVAVRYASDGQHSAPPPLVVRVSRAVLEKGGPIVLKGADAAPPEWQRDIVDAGGMSCVAVPLKAAEGILGVLAFTRKGEPRLGDHELQLASLFQSLAALLLDREARISETRAVQESARKLKEQLGRREQEIRALNNLMQGQQATSMDLEERVQGVTAQFTGALRSLVNLMEGGDPARPGRSENVANWLSLLAKPLGLPSEGLKEIAYLHDVGMPRAGAMLKEELQAAHQQQVLQHPFIAYAIAETLALSLEVRLAIKHHHENYDGSGYPDGLAGESVPLRSRLLRVADDLVDSLSSTNGPRTAAEAVMGLKAKVGRQYDPKVVETLERLVTEGSGGSATEMISTVTHELRSPLSFLVGYSELLASQEGLSDEAKEQAGDIHEEAVHMSKLVEDLLNVSRYEAGRVDLRWQEIDLGEFVHRAVVKCRAKRSGHQIEERLFAGALMVMADPDKLEQVLDNLLDNAVKYSPSGGRIVVSVAQRSEQVVTSVSDQGIGIPKAQRARLFEKFYRVDSPLKDKVPGTGLGLSLCKHIVEAHGGNIWVDSEEGKGSTFSFSLPLGRAN